MLESHQGNPFVATPPRRAVAGAVAMTGFAIAVLTGLAAGNPVEEILLRSVICLFACLAVGTVVGLLCEAAVTEYLENFVKAYPVPDSNVEVEDLAVRMHGDSSSDSVRSVSESAKVDSRNLD